MAANRSLSAIVTMPPAHEVPSHRKLSFFDLPAEIRVIIYRLLLLSSKFIKSELMYNPEFGYNRRTPGIGRRPIRAATGIHGQLVRTCRQIRAEANAVLYTSNDFYAPDITKALFELGGRLGEENASLIEAMWIGQYACEGTSGHGAFGHANSPLSTELNQHFKFAANYFTGLKNLTIGYLAPFVNVLWFGKRHQISHMRVVRFVVRQTLLGDTVANYDNVPQYVRFTADGYKPDRHEVAFNIYREFREYHANIAAKKKETAARWKRNRDLAEQFRGSGMGTV